MSLLRTTLPGGRRGVPGRAGLALALAAAVALAAGGGEPTLKGLYDAARRAYEADATGPEYNRAAAAVVARGSEAVEFLTGLLDSQAFGVRDENEVRSSGILVTLDLLGRMSSYAGAKSALRGMASHPVGAVRDWAAWALKRPPQTQPAASRPATSPASTQPEEPRIEGERLVTAEGWFARPKVHRPALPRQVTSAYVIPIRGPIGLSTRDAVKRKLIRCRAQGGQIVIFEMDTPGGRGDAMLGIIELIFQEMNDITTVAYVNRDAYSAGALISLACHEIVMAPRAVIGDAMPIMIGPQGELVPLPREERAKMESGILAEVRNVAQRRGYSQDLCQAMVTLSMEIWLVRNSQTGELRTVDAAQWRGKVAGAPAGEAAPAAAAPAPGEEGPWEYVRRVVGPDKLVALTTDEAVADGLAVGVCEDMAALKDRYRVIGEIARLEDNWSESLVAFLTSTPVKALLLFIGLLCAYAELNTPGFGVAGGLALVCFAILFGSNYLTGMAQWWEVGVFLLGLVLIAVEVFVTPGFGVLGVLGILFCVTGLLAILVGNPPGALPVPTTPLDWQMFGNGAAAFGAAFIAAVIAGAVLARFLPRLPLASRLMLAPVAAATGPPVAPGAPIERIGPGDRGVVESTCRPVGMVRFGEDLVDAMTEGDMIERNARVRVLRREGNRLVIERCEDA